MRRVPALLLVLAACQHKPAERPSGIADSAPSLRRAAPPVRPADTTRWVDTTGDTLTYGRLIVPASYVVVDSVRPPKQTIGIPFGASGMPLDSLNRPTFGYTGSIQTINASTLKSDLDKTRARKGRLILAISRDKTKDANGLSVAATRMELKKWDWPTVRKALADTVALGIYVADDITSSEWGPNAPYLARTDSLCRLVDSFAPGSACFIRAKPTELTKWTWRWATTAWAQNKGPYRDGDPKKWVATQVASAKAQHLGLVIGPNFLDGGCGPTSACLPGVPGTATLGTYKDAASVRRYQMSAAEVLAYGSIFAAEPYNCAIIGWRWSPNYSSSTPTAAQLAGIRRFHADSVVALAMKGVSAVASNRPFTSCKQR